MAGATASMRLSTTIASRRRTAKGGGRLEKLIYSYLGDWIDRQRADQKAGVEGADARLAHAEHLKTELSKILEGEPPYDIFVRWKPLHEQPIGWDPDINDGVRINIRPFMTARPLNARGANACILRGNAEDQMGQGSRQGTDPRQGRLSLVLGLGRSRLPTLPAAPSSTAIAGTTSTTAAQ